jgi:membrane protease YdiL (CAAX protease family)
MTALAWLAWRFLEGRQPERALRPALVWLANGVSALLFGVLHLPLAVWLIDDLEPALAVLIVGVNAALGLLFGYLFWRRGLESAMIAHAMAHVVSYTANAT